MSLSRRDFTVHYGRSSGIPNAVLAETLYSKPSQARYGFPLHEFIKNQTLVDALRRGVQVMRSRAPSDPRSWFFQEARHAVNDALLAGCTSARP